MDRKFTHEEQDECRREIEKRAREVAEERLSEYTTIGELHDIASDVVDEFVDRNDRTGEIARWMRFNAKKSSAIQGIMLNIHDRLEP